MFSIFFLFFVHHACAVSGASHRLRSMRAGTVLHQLLDFDLSPTPLPLLGLPQLLEEEQSIDFEQLQEQMSGSPIPSDDTASDPLLPSDDDINEPFGVMDEQVARQTLPKGDGWASEGAGTTGGAEASPENVFIVSTWHEFRAALGGDDASDSTTPKLVLVNGMLDANIGGTNPRPDCSRYSSSEHQTAQVRQDVGSNVSIVGLTKDSGLRGANLRINNVNNVIVRNLRLSDAYDCFPAFESGDGWNSLYDNVVVQGATNVWIDHCTFDDGQNPPWTLPERDGEFYEVHDGLLDITNQADLVTVSYCRFREHKKAFMIGNSDSKTTDRGKLRVTVHHCMFELVEQRLPRVRFGQVHVYNNVYRLYDGEGMSFSYALGVGKESQIYADHNLFLIDDESEAYKLIKNMGGEQVECVNNFVGERMVDIFEEYSSRKSDLRFGVDWKPTLVGNVNDPRSLESLLEARSGSGNI